MEKLYRGPYIDAYCQVWFHLAKLFNFDRQFFMSCFGNQLCGKGGQSHILRGSKGVGVTIESYGKVEISYINVDNF
jgi:hypothetical protein